MKKQLLHLSDKKFNNIPRLRSRVNKNSKNQIITVMKVLSEDSWKNYEDFNIINPSSLFGEAVPDLSNGMRMNCQVLIRTSNGETYKTQSDRDFIVIKNGEHLLAKSYIKDFEALAKESIFSFGGLNIWGEEQVNKQYPLDRVFNTLDGINYSGTEDSLTINLYVPETRNCYELLEINEDGLQYDGYKKNIIFKKNIDYGDKITFNKILVFGNLKTPSPTPSPTLSPTPSPTESPTMSPTISPTVSPTVSPTSSPTLSPTQLITQSPTLSPTNIRTISPTSSPTFSPTKVKVNLTSLLLTNMVTSLNDVDSYFNNYIKMLFNSPFSFEIKNNINYNEENCTINILIITRENFSVDRFTLEQKNQIIYDIKSQILSDLLNILNGICIEKEDISINYYLENINQLGYEISIKNVTYLDLNSLKLTSSPTTSPTVSPTISPTVSPTIGGTASPTMSPTYSPTSSPTVSPTASPTVSPTLSPTNSPTPSPTEPEYCEINTPNGVIYIYPGIDLSNSNLTNVDLRDCSLLRNCNLNNAILKGIIVNDKTDFTGCILNGVISGEINTDDGFPILPIDVNGNKLWDIKKGYLLGPGTNIKDSSEFNVDLSNQDLSNLILLGANLIDVVLTGSNINNTIFNSAKLSGITSGNLSGIPKSLPNNWKLIKGYLVGPGSNLMNANLSNSDLSNVVLRNEVIINYGERITNLENANLENCIFKNINIQKANFKNSNLNCIVTKNLSGQPNLETFPDGFIFDLDGYPINGYFIGPGIDLSGVNLSNTDLSGTNLAGTKLNDSNFEYCNFQNVLFNPPLIRNDTIVKTDCANTSFIGSNFSNLIIKNCIFNNANFTCAILRYVVIDTTSNLLSAKLSGVIGLDTVVGLDTDTINDIISIGDNTISIPGNMVELNHPGGISISGNYIYLADTSNNIIRRSSLDEPYYTTIIAGDINYSGETFPDGSGIIAKFLNPKCLKIYGEYLYVLDHNNTKIRRISLEEPFMVSTVITSELDNPINDFIIQNGKILLMGKNMSYINHEEEEFTYTSFALDKNHYIGIGLTKPEVKLHVSGKVRFSNLGESVINSGNSVAGISCNAKGDLLYESSDIQLKDQILELNNGISVIKDLRPRYFRWKNNGEKDIGFIAQEVGNSIPTALKTNPNGYCNYNNRSVLAYAVKAIQELNEKLDNQNKKFIELEDKYNKLINKK